MNRLNMLGTYYLTDRQFKKAEEYADRMIERDAEFMGGWINKAEALAGQGREAEAIESLEKALDIFYVWVERAQPEFVEVPTYILRRISELHEGMNNER